MILGSEILTLKCCLTCLQLTIICGHQNWKLRAWVKMSRVSNKEKRWVDGAGKRNHPLHFGVWGLRVLGV